MRQRFALDAIPATPWKNGGGSTRELVCWPPRAGLQDFDWRISVATIARGGPFSVFPGIDRRILLLEGGGVQLRSRDEAVEHRLDARLQPFSFSGDVPLTCELLGGVSIDFNVMTRRGRCRAELQVLRDTAALAPAAHGLLLALQGDWQLRAATHESIGCSPRQGWWWADGASAALIQATPARGPAPVLLAVRIEDVQP